MANTLFTNGTIAVKERELLGEKLIHFCELGAEEVLRTLRESGFGGGAGESAADAELLCAAEEESLDSFIREYAPGRAHAAYFLLPRDYHNMKALVKAKLLSEDPAPMLAPAGFRTVEALKERVETDPAFPWEEWEHATGAEIGAAFDRALYDRLFAVCGRSRILRTLLRGKVDRINLLTALRSGTRELFEAAFLAGGTLKKETLCLIFGDEAAAAAALQGTPYADFFASCMSARERGKPFTEAENMLASFEAEYFRGKRFELEGKEPFLYYVFRRRAEIANVRIILVCLRAGVPGGEIKKRLRAV